MINVYQSKQFNLTSFYGIGDICPKSKILDMFVTLEKDRQYELVAEVATDNLDEAYHLTNSIEQGWWMNEKVNALFLDNGCRSTSMGDILLVCHDNGSASAYIVAKFGFEKLF